MEKKNFKMESIWDFKREYKLTKKDLRLLFEAFRRMEFLGSGGRDENYNMLGLGSPSQYKSKYFVPSFGETPKVTNWYKLSESGKEMVKKIKSYFLIPRKHDARNNVNEFLFSL